MSPDMIPGIHRKNNQKEKTGPDV